MAKTNQYLGTGPVGLPQLANQANASRFMSAQHSAASATTALTMTIATASAPAALPAGQAPFSLQIK